MLALLPMSLPSQSDFLGRLVRPSIGAETRAVIQRRADIRALNDQFLNPAVTSPPPPDLRASRVSFLSPEVSASFSPVYHDAVAALPPLRNTPSPLDGLRRRFRTFSNLFSPRQPISPSDSVASSAESLTWDPLLDPHEVSDAFSPAARRALLSPRPPHRVGAPLPPRVAFDASDDDDDDAGMQQPVQLRPPAPHVNAPRPQQIQPHRNVFQPEPLPQLRPLLQQQQQDLQQQQDHQQQPVDQQQQHGQQPNLQPPPVVDGQPQQPPAPPAPPLDDYDDFSPTMASLLPVGYKGHFSEDAKLWFDTAAWYVQTQRTQTERQKIALVGVLLLDEARRWFLSEVEVLDVAPGDGNLAPGQVVTFAQFKAAFLLRFERPQAQLWREQALIWSCKQKTGQNTQSFVSELQELAQRARVPAPQVLQAAISGLRAEVKTFCMAHELGDIQDLLKWANIFEMCAGPAPPDTGATLERLEKAIEKLQVRATSPASPGAARQVRFADQSPDRQLRQSGGQRGGREPNSAFRGRGMPANRAASFGQRWSSFGNPGPFHYNVSGQRPPRGRGQVYYGRSDNTQRAPCSNCGRGHEWGACPARNSVCRACEKRGHWSNVCRSTQH